MKALFSFFWVLISGSLWAQVTYYADVKPIIDQHCIECHTPGGVAPFPLTTYEDLAKRASFVKVATQNRYMPPWYADPQFQNYHGQRRLSEEDLQTIAEWADKGAPKGKASKEVKKKEETAAWPEPDLNLSMQKPFVIPGTNTEQFRIFVIPTETTEDRYVRAIDFRPGNKRQAHHARLMLDTTHLLRPDDGVMAGDSNTEFTRRNVQLANSFWFGWVPGNFPVFYPDGVGKLLPKGTDIILNMHYSPSPVPASDQSHILLYYTREKPRRLINTFILDENWVTNGPFVIPANQQIKFYMRSPLVPNDMTLISVLPHMHLLGKSIKAYAITPAGQVVPLIHIPEWNFNWQMAYPFQKPIKLPKGSVVYVEAVFDNTVNNPRNPQIPPRDATYGWGTLNEMLNLVVEYLDYQPGDESLDWYGPAHD